MEVHVLSKKCEMDIEHLEIIVGTYEEFLLGYKVVQEENEEFTLVQSFANHSHRASVRSVAAGGKFLASGGADESILLYNMDARKEAGLLMQHHGNVNCLEFSPNGSHLLSGSEDGAIGVCRSGSWQLEKLWGSAHKGSGVTSISIHPSGKLFLSVGTDATLRTWNLVKGRAAYATNLCKIKDGRSVIQVLWSPNGETYAVVIGTRVEIYTVAAASVVHTIEIKKKVTCICFVEENLLCVATEEGDVLIHNIDEKKEAGQFKAHDGRIRCMTCYEKDWIVTATSSGCIKLWKRKDRSRVCQVPVCETNVGCRITCLTVISSTPTPRENKELLMCAALDLEETLSANLPKIKKRPMGVVTVEDSEETKPDPPKKKKRRQKKVNKSKAKQNVVNDCSSSDGESEIIENPKKLGKTIKRDEIESDSDSSSSEDESDSNVKQPMKKKTTNNPRSKLVKVDEESSEADDEYEEIETQLKSKSKKTVTKLNERRKSNVKLEAVSSGRSGKLAKKKPIADVEVLATKAATKKQKKVNGSKTNSSSGAWSLE